MLHGQFLVQSNVKGPDALLERINSYLQDMKDNKIKNLSEQDLDLSKKALIKSLEQKVLKLSEEVGDYWDAITDETGIYDF